MNAVVTGGTGFIGSHICKSLVALDHNVICVDDLSGSNTDNIEDLQQCGNFNFIPADCAELKTMEGVMHGKDIDVLVHCAANAREGASQFQPVSVTHRNLMAYNSVLTASISASVRRVVMFSSMATYGKGAAEPPFDETMPTAPEDVYGVNKVAMEQCTDILSDVHGYEYVIIRPHNVFGENQALFDKMRNVVAIFMNRIMRGEPLFIYGDGEQERSFSYIHDSLPSFMNAILANGAMFTTRLHKKAINVGGKENITVNRLASAVKEAMGVSQDYPTEHFDDRPREVKKAFCTTERSEVLLNYSEPLGWEEGVIRMADWAKRMGPQDWRNTEKLEILNSDLVPKPWLEK
jgi:UDP-glucose 4-epimerase